MAFCSMNCSLGRLSKFCWCCFSVFWPLVLQKKDLKPAWSFKLFYQLIFALHSILGNFFFSVKNKNLFHYLLQLDGPLWSKTSSFSSILAIIFFKLVVIFHSLEHPFVVFHPLTSQASRSICSLFLESTWAKFYSLDLRANAPLAACLSGGVSCIRGPRLDTQALHLIQFKSVLSPLSG